MSSTFPLLIAGNETTTRLIANMTVALHDHPDQQALLAENPDLIPAAVEEGLRYDSPVQTIARVATADTEIGGEVILQVRNADALVYKPILGATLRGPERVLVSA